MCKSHLKQLCSNLGEKVGFVRVNTRQTALTINESHRASKKCIDNFNYLSKVAVRPLLQILLGKENIHKNAI